MSTGGLSQAQLIKIITIADRTRIAYPRLLEIVEEAGRQEDPTSTISEYIIAQIYESAVNIMNTTAESRKRKRSASEGKPKTSTDYYGPAIAEMMVYKLNNPEVGFKKIVDQFKSNVSKDVLSSRIKAFLEALSVKTIEEVPEDVINTTTTDVMLEFLSCLHADSALAKKKAAAATAAQ